MSFKTPVLLLACCVYLLFILLASPLPIIPSERVTAGGYEYVSTGVSNDGFYQEWQCIIIDCLGEARSPIGTRRDLKIFRQHIHLPIESAYDAEDALQTSPSPTVINGLAVTILYPIWLNLNATNKYLHIMTPKGMDDFEFWQKMDSVAGQPVAYLCVLTDGNLAGDSPRCFPEYFPTPRNPVIYVSDLKRHATMFYRSKKNEPWRIQHLVQLYIEATQEVPTFYFNSHCWKSNDHRH